jgi:hypothetical protein
MADERESRGTAEAKETKGMGSGVIVGVIVGIGLFMLTVQFLYMAK